MADWCCRLPTKGVACSRAPMSVKPKEGLTMRTSVIAALSFMAGALPGAAVLDILHAQTQPPVYFIAENDISDTAGYLKEYAPRARDMIKANGGRYVAAGDATTFVGEPPKSRVAIFVFDNMEQ